MAPEIADSEGESEFNSPERRPTTFENAAATTGPSPHSVSTFDFDQFLDPTQRLSSVSPNHAIGTADLGGATSTHEDGGPVADLDLAPRSALRLFGELSPIAPKKRAHSAIQDDLRHPDQGPTEKRANTKRSKTYGTISKLPSSEDIDLFAPPTSLGAGPQYTEPIDQENSAEGHSPISLGLNTMASIASRSSKAVGAVNLTGQSLTSSSHRITTSAASVGQYSSIDLDFRGAGQGMNINANPFGSLSQVSLDDDPTSLETRLIASTSAANEGNSHPLDVNGDMLLSDISMNRPINAYSEFTPQRPLMANPSLMVQNDGAVCDPATESPYEVSDTMKELTEAVSSRTERTEARKRGPKAKVSRVTSQSPVPTSLDEPDEPHFPPPTTRSRRGTIDSVSQASQASATHGPSKRRKRGKSKQLDEEETQPKLTESSPVKEPTSELNLSDEAMIGLPKEAYKPRPSRSRSKWAFDEEPLPIPEESHETPIKAAPKAVPEVEKQTPSTTSAKSGSKRGRKAKVKRAKTSAAALLKKADPMLSEGEEDVVWMDSKPAPVKLDLPPNLKVLKKEPEASNQEEEQMKDNRNEMTSTKGNGSKITIEIPSVAEAKDPLAEPKKRGRKPKKAQPKSEAKIVEEEEEQDEQPLVPRPPLTEKCPNVPNAEQGDVDKDIDSPSLSPAKAAQEGSEGGVDMQDTERATPSKEASTTPSKPASASEKGPTKHSPINPPGLSSGKKITYRIGLSRRQNIPSLLRKVQRDKAPPKLVARKEKESKKKKDDNGDGDNEGDGNGPGEMRGPDGMLIEWDH